MEEKVWTSSITEVSIVWGVLRQPRIRIASLFHHCDNDDDAGAEEEAVVLLPLPF
jgi:hypothetical protein